jgi:hypothetical protein
MILAVTVLLVSSLAQQDPLEGRWEGTVQLPQGERPVTALFKKQGNSYTGTITGLRGDVPFKEVKLEGNRVTAKAEIESPQGTFLVNYEFTLEGETLKGEGKLDFGGQIFSFSYNLKRGASPQDEQGRPPQGRRVSAPQPQQKQSLDYFLGQWDFKWVGRESPLGPGGVRQGKASFNKVRNGDALECTIEWSSEGKTFRETYLIRFDEQSKVLSFSGELSSGVQFISQGDWSSPIAIRFQPVAVKSEGLTFQLRRTISVISAHSFSMLEEISAEGGPFERLGNAIFSKVGQQ